MITEQLETAETKGTKKAAAGARRANVAPAKANSGTKAATKKKRHVAHETQLARVSEGSVFRSARPAEVLWPWLASPLREVVPDAPSASIVSLAYRFTCL